jgi:hypothetical protein
MSKVTVLNIVWIRIRNRNFFNVGTGTAINHYPVPQQCQVERFHLTPDMLKPAHQLSPHDEEKNSL